VGSAAARGHRREVLGVRRVWRHPLQRTHYVGCTLAWQSAIPSHWMITTASSRSSISRARSSRRIELCSWMTAAIEVQLTRNE
jgi:hypothetical protein